MKGSPVNILSDREQTLLDVWAWYEFQRLLVGEEKSRVLGALSSGMPIAAPRYIGKTRDELEGDFAYQTFELGQLTMLGMLASTEAALRIDFIERVSNKKKDTVSREFRQASRKQRIEKIRLEEDILDIWRKHNADTRIKNAVAHYKGALGLRHWLAHGRYWKPKLGRAAGYDVVDVFDICKELLQSTGLTLA